MAAVLLAVALIGGIMVNQQPRQRPPRDQIAEITRQMKAPLPQQSVNQVAPAQQVQLPASPSLPPLPNRPPRDDVAEITRPVPQPSPPTGQLPPAQPLQPPSQQPPFQMRPPQNARELLGALYDPITQAFGKRAGQEGYNDVFDINKDGVVNIFDVMQLRKPEVREQVLRDWLATVTRRFS